MRNRSKTEERPHPRTQFTASYLVREWVELPLKATTFAEAMAEASALGYKQVSEQANSINDHSCELINVGNRMYSKVDD